MGIRNIIKNLIIKNQVPTAPEEKTEQESSVTNPSRWFINWLGGGETSSGELVDEETAMKMAAVYACVRVLSQSVAKLPIHVYKKEGSKKEKACFFPRQEKGARRMVVRNALHNRFPDRLCSGNIRFHQILVQPYQDHIGRRVHN